LPRTEERIDDGGGRMGPFPPPALPVLLVAFSVSIMWWAYSAVCSGMTRSTEVAAAPMLSDFNTSRRDTDMLYLPFLA
jgi:hypothetical protein